MHTHAHDDALLGVFKQLGVDAQKPREVNFHFVFRCESDADNAVRVLAERKVDSNKLKVELPWWKRLFSKPNWAVIVTRQMALDESMIKNITTAFQQVARQCNGDYDGWEANVMDDQIDLSQLNNTNQ